MQVLFLSSAYRKHGNTAAILGLIESKMASTPGFDELNIEFETIYLAHRDIRPCRGCRLCFNKGEQFCPLNDDIAEILSRIRQADVIIAASPVYVNDVNGAMKNWMDRLAFICHRPELGEKMVFFIATVGGSVSFQALLTLGGAFATWGAYSIGKKGFKMGELMKPEEIDRKYSRTVEKIARKIIRSVRQKSYLRPTFLSLLTFRIQQLAWQHESTSSYDYDYWFSHGWILPKSTYYFQTKANPLKVVLARLFGMVVAKTIL